MHLFKSILKKNNLMIFLKLNYYIKPLSVVVIGLINTLKLSTRYLLLKIITIIKAIKYCEDIDWSFY